MKKKEGGGRGGGGGNRERAEGMKGEREYLQSVSTLCISLLTQPYLKSLYLACRTYHNKKGRNNNSFSVAVIRSTCTVKVNEYYTNLSQYMCS